TETATRTVTLHVTGSCPLDSGSSGKYFAPGDFEPLPANLSQQPLATDDAGQTIEGVPSNVKSLALVAEAQDSSVWLSTVLVAPSGDVDMLLLPSASVCALNGNGVGFANQMVLGAVSQKTLLALGATVAGGANQSFR